MGPSAAQQIAHWARIGRELEAAGSISHRDVADVLAWRTDYDQLTAHEQALVRAQWAERMDARRQDLDLAQGFSEQGGSYVELDDHGQVVCCDPCTDGSAATV